MSSRYPPDARCVDCGHMHMEHDQVLDGFFTCPSSNGGHEFRAAEGQRELDDPHERMLTKEERWELLQIQNRLVEEVKNITRLIEQGYLTHVGKKEMMANLDSIRGRAGVIPCRPPALKKP